MSSSASRMKKCERVDDRFAVADEHRARAPLQHAVAQQRDQRRHEDEVVGAGRPDALHRLVRDFGRRIVEQRDRAAAGIAARRCAGSRWRRRAAPCGWRRPNRPSRSSSTLSASVDVGRLRAAGQRDCRGRADARIRIGQQRPGQRRRRPRLVDRRQRADRRGPDARVGVRQRPADLRHPLLGDVAARPRRARRARAPAPPATRGRAAAASPGCACPATRARRSRRRRGPARDAPAPGRSVSTVDRSPPLRRTSAGARSRRSMLWRNAVQVAAPGAQRHDDPQPPSRSGSRSSVAASSGSGPTA